MEIILIRQNESGERSHRLQGDPEQTVYEIARQAGYRLPVSCLNGVCHLCKAQLASGSVLTGSAKEAVDGNAEVMLCRTWPHSDCTLTLKNLYAPGELPLNKLKCQVADVTCLKGHVFQIDLQLPAGKQPEFFAGQYLALHLSGKSEPSFYSIASAPGQRLISLHIQADPHLLSALEVVEHFQSSMTRKVPVSVSLPFGEACLSSLPEQPIIMIASGTGFAQMKSMLEYLFAHHFELPVSLYWGVRKPEDMYLQGLAEKWAEQFANFNFYPLIGELDANEQDEADNVAHHERLSQAVLLEQKVENTRVFVSGSPKLVFAIMDNLLAAGLPEASFYSDVLAYAKRP